VLSAMQEVVPTLLREDGVVFQLIAEKQLDTLLQEVTQITSSEQKLVTLLTQANAEANRYAQAYGVGAKEAKGKK
jgi:hypothetical protein